MGWLDAIRLPRGGAPVGAAEDETFDVVVVGFGAAGAAAAIQAADEGSRVLVVDRFEGGGATRLSGGVFYAGGGTGLQKAAGFDDTPELMLAYLRAETQGVVPDATLRAFCESSAESFRWLEGLGVRFGRRFFGEKTAYPPDGCGLYYSGNEKQRHSSAPPIPRGHVPEGIGQTGHVLFDALRRAALDRGVEVRARTRAVHLLRGADGAVTGVELLALRPDVPARQLHRALHDLGLVSRSIARPLGQLEQVAGRGYRVRARGGVVVAAGGFVWNPKMLEEHAPAYARGMPLGTPGDDGAGIMLGAAAGGALAEMGSCAACRFLYPPESFVTGLLVNERGERFCDESLYGATVSRAIAGQPRGRAFLVLDSDARDRVAGEAEAEERLRDRPFGQIVSGEMNALVYRKLTTAVNLHLNRRRADSLAALAEACGIDPGSLEATIRAHNARVEAGEEDPVGKPLDYVRPVRRPPFDAVRCDLANPLFPAPTFTLGGLQVAGTSAQVARVDGAPIPGLYAAGRSAVGVCSRSYVSGLSIADCVFSGRNAGRSAAAAARERLG